MKRFWLLRCDCGQDRELPYNALASGNTQSCGCLLRDAITTHGGYRDATYKVWHAMHERCRNSALAEFKDYGGRGISVCADWSDYARFMKDMGPRPDGGTLERIDVNGGYTKENCCWATQKEQANNRRNNRRITIGDQTMTLAQWAEKSGLTKGCLIHRLKNGWEPAAAVSTASNRSASNILRKAPRP